MVISILSLLNSCQNVIVKYVVKKQTHSCTPKNCALKKSLLLFYNIELVYILFFKYIFSKPVDFPFCVIVNFPEKINHLHVLSTHGISIFVMQITKKSHTVGIYQVNTTWS